MDNANTKQKLIVQIVCLLLSIGLWFYITNIENPLTNITLNKVPVKIVNEDSLLSSNLVLVQNQELYVSLKIEGLSRAIRKIGKEDFEIKVDLSEYALKNGSNKIFVNIVDYPANITVKNSNNLFVQIYTEEYVQKEVYITSDINIVPKPNYYTQSPIFTEEKVKVSGPNSLVSRVTSVVATGQESNVDETISKIYKIQPVDASGNVVDGVTLSQNTVEATIKVNKGKIVPLKINTMENIKSNLRVNSIKLNIEEIEIIGPLDKMEQISEIYTEPIDLSTITDDTTFDVKLNITEGIQVNFHEEPLKVTIDVDKIIEREIDIPFEIVGLNEGLTIETKKEQIQVKISGFEGDVSQLSEKNFKAQLDVSQKLEAGSYKGIPKIEIINSDVEVKIEAVEEVEYNIALVSE